MTPQQQLDAYRAALSRPATPPLDVERLARAMDKLDVLDDDEEWTGAEHRAYARDIAREYAALANPDQETA